MPRYCKLWKLVEPLLFLENNSAPLRTILTRVSNFLYIVTVTMTLKNYKINHLKSPDLLGVFI